MKTKEEIVDAFLSRNCPFEKAYERIRSELFAIWECGYANGQKSLSTQIKERCDKSYHLGFEAGHNGAYQDGLEDAWLMIGKITGDGEDSYDSMDLLQALGTEELHNILEIHPNTVLQKLEQYENEKDQKITNAGKFEEVFGFPPDPMDFTGLDNTWWENEWIS